jgi:hypothetical protein
MSIWSNFGEKEIGGVTTAMTTTVSEMINI